MMLCRLRAWMERRRALRPSIRGVAGIWMVSLGILVLLMVGALVWTSRMLHHSIAAVINDSESQLLVSEIEASFLIYNRLSNLYVVTREVELDEARTQLEEEMGALLAQAKDAAGSSDEKMLLDAASVHLTAYLEERKAVEARSLPLPEVVRLMRPTLTAASRELEALRKLNAAQVREADAQASRVHELAKLSGSAAGVMLLVALVAIALGIRQYLLRPLVVVHECMARFRAGESETRIPVSGLRETAELAQGFNEMAEALARQREDQLTFLAGVAHDLRNPLAALKIGIHSLGEEPLEPRERTCARLDRQVDRLARMVEDLLDATRIEAGKLELRPAEVDLREVVEDMVRLYGPTSPKHQLSVELPEGPLSIEGDPLRLEQVVSNLLSNAIKFSPDGGPIVVSLQTKGEEAILSVADEGIGIPAEEVAEVFRPFRRRRPDVAPGVGLGLSVVRRIVTAHRGRIEVESSQGSGTTFRVYIPRCREKSLAGTEVDDEERPRGRARSPGPPAAASSS